MSFAGKRVLSLESRRSAETAELIRRNGGDPVVAPSMREVPLESNVEALDFGERLLSGEFDMVILLTGVGTRQLIKVLTTRFALEDVLNALKRVTVVARGPKPVGALRELQLRPDVVAPEPNTWRELLTAIADKPAERIALQEYGRPSAELLQGLHARGCTVTQVPVYTYALPDDLGPLRDAISLLAKGEIDVALFTTAQQIAHLYQIAGEMGLQREVSCGLGRSMVASIGPTTTQMLAEMDLIPDLEASHPKLGFLVKEAAEQSSEILCRKRM